jgi:hypothetical protein
LLLNDPVKINEKLQENSCKLQAARCKQKPQVAGYQLKNESRTVKAS